MRDGAAGAPASAERSREKTPSPAPTPSPSPWSSCRLRRFTSVLLDYALPEGRRRRDVGQEGADVAAAPGEVARERRHRRALDGDGRATERVAKELLGGAPVNHAAARGRGRERDAAVEGAVDVGAGDRTRGVDGQPVVGRLVFAGRVVVLESEAEAIQRPVTALAGRGLRSRLEQHAVGRSEE